jgi:hypothetical protein
VATIGLDLAQDQLILQKGRDFRWQFQHVDDAGSPANFPAGSLYFEFATAPVTTWTFQITGADAALKVESTAVDLIPARTSWQLVFRPAGEAAGGDPVARGTVSVQE